MTSIPQKWNRLQVAELNTDPKKALKVAQIDAAAPNKDQVTLKIQYVGINATDINTFVGSYGGGATPFDAGLEALGTVVAAGEDMSAKYKIGTPLLIKGMGSWYDYKNVDASAILCPVPAVDPRYLTLPISVLTAAITVGEQSEAKAGEVAVVTAAAGGFGQFTVQYLKKKGVTVVGTCSNDDKAEFLKSLGVDRIVNYKKEDLGEVLKKEYPRGVDIVYETIGGKIFEQCVENLGIFGRLIVIGSITGYKEQKAFQDSSAIPPLPKVVLSKSASIKGFFLPHWSAKAEPYLVEAIGLIAKNEMVAKIDEVKTFSGLDQVAEAVEHLHNGASFGKVVVKIQE